MMESKWDKMYGALHIVFVFQMNPDIKYFHTTLSLLDRFYRLIVIFQWMMVEPLVVFIDNSHKGENVGGEWRGYQY